MRVYLRGNFRWEVDSVDGGLESRDYDGDALVSEQFHAEPNELRAKWAMETLCRARESSGFQRQSTLVPALTNEDFSRTLLENPNDPDTFAVYADWLTGRGDPWGELMNVQCILESPEQLDPSLRRTLERRAAAILFLSSGELWGDFGEVLIDANSQLYASDAVIPTWYCGFVSEATLRPFGADSAWSVADILAAAAKRPIMQLVSVLRIHANPIKPADLAECTRHPFPLLRRIEISLMNRSQTRDPQFAGAKLAPILESDCTPSLEEIAIEGLSDAEAFVAAISVYPNATRLRELVLTRSVFTEAALDRLCQIRFRNLRYLRLSGFGLPEEMPRRLRDLAEDVRIQTIRDAEFTDEDDFIDPDFVYPYSG